MNEISKLCVMFFLLIFVTYESIPTQFYTRRELNSQDFYINSTHYSVGELISYIQSIEELYELDPEVLIWKAILYEEAALFKSIIPFLNSAQVLASNMDKKDILYTAKMHELYFSLFFKPREDYLLSLEENKNHLLEYKIVNRGEAIIESLELGCMSSTLWSKVKGDHISLGSYKYNVKPTFYLFRVHANQSILKKCDSQAIFFHESIKKELSEYPGNKYLTLLDDVLEIDKKYRENSDKSAALNSYQSLLDKIKGSGYRPWIELAIEYRLFLICELSGNTACNKKQNRYGIDKDYIVGSENSYFKEILSKAIRESSNSW